MSDADTYIWVCRWEEFQHYPPERDRPPAWIKDYPKQLDDERYLRLTDRQRALIRDLRDVFATMHGRLPDDAAMIARRRGRQTRDADLRALNHAGLIEFVSRETLELRLEQLYSSPRAPAQSRREVLRTSRERLPLTPRERGTSPRQKGTNPRAEGRSLRQEGLNPRELNRYTGCRLVRGSHGLSYQRDPLGVDTPPSWWTDRRPSRDEIRAALEQREVVG